MIGAGKIKQYTNVIDKPLGKGKQEVSLSAFALLFSQLVQYNQTQVDNIAKLERRLEDAGYVVGARVLEPFCHPEMKAIICKIPWDFEMGFKGPKDLLFVNPSNEGNRRETR